jgi:DNA polymerase-3 subunit delta'
MALKDIIGQQKAIGMLVGAMQRNRVANSYLFVGESGIGKKTAAVNFAKALNCLTYAAADESPPSGEHAAYQEVIELSHDACDACESCRKIDSGTHPDLLFISPEDRQVRIDEIRKIDEALSFRPFEGSKKIVIVDNAEAMNISAANAFLKTLEEPPRDSVIILVSSKPDYLPDTIRSRCSTITFVSLSLSSCKKIIAEKVTGENLELVARLSMGNPGSALVRDMLEEREWFLKLLKSMLKAEKDSWTSREEMERWCELVLILLRDIAVVKITGEPSRLINIDQLDYILELGNSHDVSVIIYCYMEIDTIRRSLHYNRNKSITWNYIASLLRKELGLRHA